ncbi:uncharacterized protein LOC129912219 [Episyrphus balteatus]|uniref:uncharacterized protein LOC129912219 n=1 Tax=Episyrphus balteatus TaxID=286459 RepID=UPI0024855633|nr:uncharacterized protein LOC129912219 [Episyrphus balteatus]
MNQLQRIAIMTVFCAAIWANTIGIPVLPVLDESSGIDNETIEGLRASVNDTPKNLYVVKAVVYEIGILTDEDENDTSSIESQERVDLTFFDAHRNSSHIDLGNIPLPIQTNVSGQVLTGIAPVNIGAFSNPNELLNTLPLTGTIVNLTHSDTSYFQLSTHNISESEKPQVLTQEEIAQIPDAANIFPSLKHESDEISKNSVPSDDD